MITAIITEENLDFVEADYCYGAERRMPKTTERSHYSHSANFKNNMLLNVRFQIEELDNLLRHKAISKTQYNASEGVITTLFPEITNISKTGVFNFTYNGKETYVDELPLSVNTTLGLALDLTRRMLFSDNKTSKASALNPLEAKATVAIEMMELHLNPQQQQEIPRRLQAIFKNTDFTISTMSPLVCSSADKIQTCKNGVLKDVSEQDFNRIRYGNILEAHSTELFGSISRSPEGHQKLQELAELNQKGQSESLSMPEIEKQNSLRATFPCSM